MNSKALPMINSCSIEVSFVEFKQIKCHSRKSSNSSELINFKFKGKNRFVNPGKIYTLLFNQQTFKFVLLKYTKSGNDYHDRTYSQTQSILILSICGVKFSE